MTVGACMIGVWNYLCGASGAICVTWFAVFCTIRHQFVAVMDWCGSARQQRKYFYHGKKYSPYDGSHIVDGVYDVDDDGIFDAISRACTVVN